MKESGGEEKGENRVLSAVDTVIRRLLEFIPGDPITFGDEGDGTLGIEGNK